ncbi:alpha/beta fold hydrolase [Patescibacteria group bacterium]|nr:alpha/beta fold hydrolase [Patescibacteria group bacterium]
MERIEIPINNEKIIGALFYPDKQKQHKVVVFLNGQGGVKERFYLMAEALVNLGYASFAFDFRGRGESASKIVPPLSYQIEDAKKVLDYVVSLPFVNPNDITLIATSMGGYVAASVASDHPGIKKIFLFEPTLLLVKEEDKPYLEITADDVELALKGDVNKMRPIQEIRKFKGELYLILHEKSSYRELMESIIPIFYKNAVKAKKKKKCTLKGARHALFKTHEGRLKATEFVEKLL